MQFTILKISEVYSENSTYRIDAEYFKSQYLDAVKKIKKHNYSYIDDVASWVTQGPNPVFSKLGIPCLTGRNISKGKVSYANSDYVNSEGYKILSRYQLKIGDTLITLKGKGSIGQIGYVTDDRHAIFSRNIGIVRPSQINSGYLYVFILCKYGKLLIDRGETGGTGQSTLTISYLKTIPIPRFSIEDMLGNFVERIEQLRKESRKSYQEAHILLLSELGLVNWQPKHRLTFIKNYSGTQQAGRIDAEHFQPKYEEIATAIKNYVGGWGMLVDLTTLKRKNYKPEDGQEYKYIELADIAENGEVTGCTIAEGQELPSRARRRVASGDVIISSIEGSLSSIAMIGEEYHRALCSTGFHVINSKSLNPETLLVLMKGIVGQLQLKKGCSGTILTAINKDEFSRIILPTIAKTMQLQIQQKVRDSFTLREQSKHLLACAKRAVEIAIEEDEQTALNWLENEAQ